MKKANAIAHATGAAMPNAAKATRDYASQGPFKEGGDGSFGIIPCKYSGRTNRMVDVFTKRLVQFGHPVTDPLKPTCSRWDVLLPPHAPDACVDPIVLAQLIDAQRMPAQTDLAILITLRFAHRGLMHQAWEMARGFARQRLAIERETPVLACMHIPQLAARHHKPHVHLLASSRRLLGSNLADFVSDLLGENGKATAGALWAHWVAQA